MKVFATLWNLSWSIRTLLHSYANLRCAWHILYLTFIVNCHKKKLLLRILFRFIVIQPKRRRVIKYLVCHTIPYFVVYSFGTVIIKQRRHTLCGLVHQSIVNAGSIFKNKRRVMVVGELRNGMGEKPTHNTSCKTA